MKKRTVFVTPVEGRIVPDPERGDDVPAVGREVPRSAYWLRAINAGDLKEGKPTTAAAMHTGDTQ
ncbi:hypothetical protein PEP31012_00861 [Pandoraea eparura]|uniref:DUF2635 domain-containing protein n=1 Tax=Pandoraea eparura TaxID=2508291 RepID=A0A5E4SR58_9BURK|nr:DUF2635 domain-containing protein [Pandoraea eparura]VVD76339.1 hypothetical protein PEP31012_00861 [Pandoraea eparura]